MGRNLRNIVDELKAVFRPKRTDYGQIYDTIREMDFFTGGPLPGEEGQWEKRFVEENGSREAFIKLKEGQRHDRL
ncbi:MAG: hypothetical protein V1766_09510 [Pseudomonadota bacterium]